MRGNILKMYKENKSLRHISKVTGHSRKYLRKILTHAGVEIRPKPMNLESDKETVSKLYNQKKSVNEISRIINEPVNRIRKTLNGIGVQIRPQGDRYGILLERMKDVNSLNEFERMIY